MTIPLKNSVFDKIKERGSLTDSELSKALIKDGFVIAEDRFNKLLLDLEIMCRTNVTWLTKDTRRIEIRAETVEVDQIEAQPKTMIEKDYEASFPGAENT